MDKLPVLSSIASYFSERTDLAYHAGLWSEKLPYELCWGPKLGNLSTRGTVKLAARPTVWRAPSWSWMCLEQPITFEDERS